MQGSKCTMHHSLQRICRLQCRPGTRCRCAHNCSNGRHSQPRCCQVCLQLLHAHQLLLCAGHHGALLLTLCLSWCFHCHHPHSLQGLVKGVQEGRPAQHGSLCPVGVEKQEDQPQCVRHSYVHVCLLMMLCRLMCQHNTPACTQAGLQEAQQDILGIHPSASKLMKGRHGDAVAIPRDAPRGQEARLQHCA